MLLAKAIAGRLTTRAKSERRFPLPWTIEPLDGCGFKIVDANKQALAYVYARGNRADADNAKVLTTDEARRIAANIAKLPKLLAK